MKVINQFFIIFAMLCATQVFAQQESDKEYKILNTAQPAHSSNKIEVLEFFSYKCPYCFKLNPLMNSFKKALPKDVELTFVPVSYDQFEETLARTFYALESLGLEEQLHENLFNSWNVENIPLMDEASVTEYITTHGVDRKKFSDAFNSSSVLGKVAQAKQIGKSYNVPGTPTLVVDGKYLVSGKDSEATMMVLYDLLGKSRQERTGKRDKCCDYVSHY